MELENLHKQVSLTDGENNSVKVHIAGHHIASVHPALGGGYAWQANQTWFAANGFDNSPYSTSSHSDLQTAIADALGAAHDVGAFDTAVEIPDDSNAMSEGHGEKSPEMPLVKFDNKKPKGGDPSGLHGLEDYIALKDKKKMTTEEMTAAQMSKRERIVKALKKSKADFVSKYGDKATAVMYATATKQAMKEEIEEHIDEAMKPYVSGDHKDGWSILNSKGKEVKKFHHSDYADHPIADKKSAAKNDAMAYLKKHFNKLSEETIEEKKDPCWKGYKQLGMKNKGGKQVPNCIPEQEEIKEEGEVLGGSNSSDPVSKTDAIARADFKLSAAGRKLRRRIVLKK